MAKETDPVNRNNPVKNWRNPMTARRIARVRIGSAKIVSLALVLAIVSGAYDRQGPTVRAADLGIEFTSVQVDNVTQESATITWTTSRPWTTQAILLDGEGYFERRFPEPMADVSPLATKHSAVISGLVPDRDYTAVVLASDGKGNAGRYPPANAKPNCLKVHTKPFDAAGLTRFRIDTYGSQSIYAGSDLYVGVYPVPLAGQKKTLDLSDVRFEPPVASITPHLIINFPQLDEKKDHHINPATKKPTHPQGLSGKVYSVYQGMKVRLRTTAATPPGQYTAVLSFTSDGMTVPARYRSTSWKNRSR